MKEKNLTNKSVAAHDKFKGKLDWTISLFCVYSYDKD